MKEEEGEYCPVPELVTKDALLSDPVSLVD